MDLADILTQHPEIVLPQFTVTTPATDTDKLAQTGLAPGTYSKITGEGDRLELFLGGDATLQANWVVLRNTALIAVSVENDAVTINGVFCSQHDSTYVWADPQEITVTSESGDDIHFDGFQSDLHPEIAAGVGSCSSGQRIGFPIPCGPRSQAGNIVYTISPSGSEG